jgi:hypothetical protein
MGSARIWTEEEREALRRSGARAPHLTLPYALSPGDEGAPIRVWKTANTADPRPRYSESLFRLEAEREFTLMVAYEGRVCLRVTTRTADFVATTEGLRIEVEGLEEF